MYKGQGPSVFESPIGYKRDEAPHHSRKSSRGKVPCPVRSPCPDQQGHRQIGNRPPHTGKFRGRPGGSLKDRNYETLRQQEDREHHLQVRVLFSGYSTQGNGAPGPQGPAPKVPQAGSSGGNRAMQVINDATTREINCPHCGSRLKVSRNDVGYVYSFAHHSYFYVECPVCEKRIELKDLGEWKKYLMRLVPDDD